MVYNGHELRGRPAVTPRGEDRAHVRRSLRPFGGDGLRNALPDLPLLNAYRDERPGQMTALCLNETARRNLLFGVATITSAPYPMYKSADLSP